MENFPHYFTLPKSRAIHQIYILILIALAISSCQKDIVDSPIPPSILEIEAPQNLSSIPTGSTIILKAKTNSPDNLRYEWKVNNVWLSNNMPQISLTTSKKGEYNIKLYVSNSAGTDSISLKYYSIETPKEGCSKWISQITEFRPAPGQYTNKSPGNPASSQTIVGKKGMVSLGGYGGYIVFNFDHTVINGNGDDFVVHGNAFKGNSEAGIVAVAFDANGNGRPDPEEWYDLAGSAHSAPGTNRNYTITYFKPSQTETSEDIQWSDNTGAEGLLKATNFHKQCYYPLFLEEGVPDKLEYSGTLLPPTAVQNPSTGNWVVGDLEWGYADNYSEKYPLVVNDDPDTRNSNKFDISNAVDKNGKSISLPAIDFVKVYTAVNQQAGWLGETSAEVCGAISLRAQ